MSGAKIYPAMCAIMRETESIGKNRCNQQQGFQFRGIDDVYNALHATFAKNGVFIQPEVLDHRIEVRTTAKGGTAYAHISKIKFHFVADDGSEVCSTTIGEAADNGDKGASKAASIALKYALFQVFLIPTESDDDDADKTAWDFKPQENPLPKGLKRGTEIEPPVKRLFTEEEAASAKAWADELDVRIYDGVCAAMRIGDLTELEYARKPEFIKLAKEHAAEMKNLDEGAAQ